MLWVIDWAWVCRSICDCSFNYIRTSMTLTSYFPKSFLGMFNHVWLIICIFCSFAFPTSGTVSTSTTHLANQHYGECIFFTLFTKHDFQNLKLASIPFPIHFCYFRYLHQKSIWLLLYLLLTKHLSWSKVFIWSIVSRATWFFTFPKLEVQTNQ